MIFLILKILGYLILAAGIGFGAGWLLRNLQLSKSLDTTRREMHDVKAKLPQLESLLRGRDEQLSKATSELRDYKNDLRDRTQALTNAEQALEKAQQELRRLEANTATARDISGELEGELLNTFDAQDDADSQMITELSKEISRLKAELSAAQAAGSAVLDAEFEALKLQLQQAEKALLEAQGDLQRETARADELERERDLQNKSLQVLHQQLDLERSRRAASA